MLVTVVVSACPEQLRGYLTRWLMEVSRGTYVGQVNARVRDEIWDFIGAHIKTGHAIMTYPDHNREQGFSVRTLQTEWQIKDIEGMQVVFHPTQKQAPPLKPGWSNAFKRKHFGR